MPIDTLHAAKRLQEEGTFSPEQAERIAEILSEMDVASATKGDLDELEGRLTSRIDRLGNRIDETSGRLDRLEEKVATQSELKAVKSDLGKQIERTEKRLLRWTMTGLGLVVAVLGALIGFVG
jgi:chromosome segregation ATPase